MTSDDTIFGAAARRSLEILRKHADTGVTMPPQSKFSVFRATWLQEAFHRNRIDLRYFQKEWGIMPEAIKRECEGYAVR